MQTTPTNDKTTNPKDVLDHVATVVEDMESLSLQAKELTDLIFNVLSFQTNASMSTLAVISTVFLPLTFLAGVFGMNFDRFPEIHLPYGYALFWFECAAITAATLWSLRRLGMFS